MPKVFAYVDETGDRGAGATASPVFGMAAVLVREADAPGLRSAVQTLRSDFGVPATDVLSWKEHAKNHDRRKRAVEVLRAVPGIQVCYVYAKKSELQAGSYRDDRSRFYNYLAFKMYKSIVWGAKYSLGATEINIRYGHVRHHDHTATKQYIEWQASQEANVPDGIVNSIRWVSADRYAESQAADLFGGFLRAATWPTGQFGYIEPAYLLDVWSRIRNSGACAIPLGIMSMPSNDVLTSETWFPCAHCRK